MSASILFKNARLIFPDRVELGDLRIAAGRIAAIGPELKPEPGDDVQMLGWRRLKGDLKTGAPADFVILGDGAEVLAAFVAGAATSVAEHG